MDESARQGAFSDSPLPYRLTVTEIAPWFQDMQAVIHETYYALRDTYDQLDDPPGWWSRLSCNHDDLLEAAK